MGSQSPRRPILLWSSLNKAGLILLCIFIALISSYKLLAVPDLKPGDIAPKTELAPTSATIIDKAAAEKIYADPVGNLFVASIDQSKSNELEEALNKKIEQLRLISSNKYADRIDEINLTEEELEWLLKSSETTKRKWEKNITESAKRILSQGIVNLAPKQLNEVASLQLFNLNEESLEAKSIAIKLIKDTFTGKSNLTKDKVRTNQILEKLVTKRAKIDLKEGSLITKKGEKITLKQYYVLDYFKKVSRRPKPIQWLSSFSQALASCGILLLIMRREKPRLKPKHGFFALTLLLIIQAIQASEIGSALTPLQLLLPPTLLLSQGIGTVSALTWMAVSSLIWPTSINEISAGEGRLIIAAIAGALVAIFGGRMRSRAQVLQIAVLIPLLGFLSQCFLLRSEITPTNKTWGQVIPTTGTLFSESLIVGALLMITILLIPIIENAFGLLTKARLMELADQERPLLRRLSKEAPGTFEHTLSILGLAEEGARSIGVDIDLIRTGSLYHDVGKLHAPEWFIENQENGINPHEQIKDPYKSADVLQAHVDEGLKLARRYRLPSPIADFIPEHQGTLKMGYFLHKAREKDPAALETRFRYKGPIPLSKETGILMLADGCEAALRALDISSTDQEACNTVRRIFKSRQLDGQLKKSSLTRAELELISRAFVSVWRRMRHRRLKYPISPPITNSKKNFLK